MSKSGVALIVLLGLVAGVGWFKAYQPLAGLDQRSFASLGDSDGATADDDGNTGQPAVERNGVAAQTIDEIEQLSGTFSQSEALYRLAASSNPRKLKSLIAQSTALADVNTRRQFLLILYARFSEINPGQSLKHVARVDHGALRYEIVREIFSAWARRDTDGAIAALKALNNRNLVQSAGDGIVLAHQHPGQLVSNEILMRLPIDYYPGPAIALAIGALAIADPADATSQALVLHDSPLRRGALHAIGETWAVSDPAAALRYAVGITSRDDRWHLEHTIVERWAGADPVAMLDVIAEMPANSHRAYLLSSAMSSIAERSAHAAIELINTRDFGVSKSSKNNMLTAAYTEWARTDFPSAILHITENLPQVRQKDLLTAVASTYARKSPLQAMDWVINYSGSGKINLVFSVMSSAARSDVDAVVSFITALENPKAHGINASDLIHRVASENPQAAMSLLNVMTGQQRLMSIRSIAQVIAVNDPQQAIEWLALLDHDSRQSAVQGMMQGWAQQDPVLAAEYISANQDYRNSIGSVIGAYARAEPSQALKWLMGFGDEELMVQHASQLFSGWAQGDPIGAAQMISEHRDSIWAASGVRTVVSMWANNSPADAAAWLASLPDNMTSSGVRPLARQWSQQDINGALGWAQDLATPLRDNALSIVLKQAPASPANLALLATISDDNIRFNLVYGMAQRYLQQGKSLEQLLRNANLTPEQETVIRERLAKVGY